MTEKPAHPNVSDRRTVSDRRITFGMIAGEASGDILGAGLIRALRQRYPNARFVGIGGDDMIAEGFHSLVPMERLSVMGLVEALAVKLPVTIVRGRSRDVMAASDVVLLASGTATLEAMLLKKPMVVGYRLSGFSYALLSKLVNVPHVALPNLLGRRQLVPELLQDDATAESLGAAVLERLENSEERSRLKDAFTELHHTLKQGADDKAAQAISELVEGGAS